jgi:alkylation response protein AidB-like acyl-CoA dehydrogenase
MNFLLSDDQLAFLDALNGLLGSACDPRHVHAVFNGDDGFDLPLWKQLCEMGLPAIMVPETHGGLDLKLIDLAIVSEALAAAAAPVPFFGHALATLAIVLAGSDSQKATWLPRLASGDALGTIAFCEGKEHWLREEWQMPGGDLLSGRKQLVPNAVEADLVIVGTSDGLALVETSSQLTISRRDSADRTRRLDDIVFDGAAAQMLPGGPESIDRLLDAAAVLLAADAFGGADHVVKMSVEYAKVREQYGQAIGGFQGLKHQLANMALAVEPGRGLYWYAAHAWDDIPDKAAHAAAQAKAHLTDVFLQASRDTVEAHGGIGFTWEHDTHIYLKRAMFDWTWLGQPERHRQRAANLAGW